MQERTTQRGFTARRLRKRYGHVEALSDASITVDAGEVVALIGDNGAGKSTLSKIIAGAVQPDAGEILMDGEPVRFSSPRDAQAAGIETVYQDLALARHLDPVANVFLGRERIRRGILRPFGVVDRSEMRQHVTTTFNELNVRIKDVSAPVSALSGGQAQSVAIARAAIWATRMVLLDEPTAALGVAQTERVLQLIRTIADRGLGVVLVSHSMPDVLEVSDRIEVLRLGRNVASFRRGEASVNDLVAAMTAGGER